MKTRVEKKIEKSKKVIKKTKKNKVIKKILFAKKSNY